MSHLTDLVDKFIDSNPPKHVLRELILEAYHSETVRFDSKGNPYWTGSGEPLDPSVKLNWED